MMLQYFPGATVVGIVARDGVVLGAERRYAYGNYVVSKNAIKVFKITESVGAACAGMVGDMQVLVKTVQAIIRRKQMETGRTMGPNSVAKVMSVLMFENRLFPLLTQVIVGGIGEKPELYVLDPLGSVIPDRYAAVGSGEEIAIGVIENDYREDMSVEQAKELALRGIKSALKRDASSGDGIDFLIITPSGSRIEYVPM
ncbi:MAG: proteasome subunit beta [Nitrososphaeria archaeon]